MKKRFAFFIIFSALILTIGCTSNDSLGGGELIQVADAVEEDIQEPIEELKEEIIEETEEPEEVIEESKEEVIEEQAEEIKEEPTEEVKEELTETTDEQTEQIEEPQEFEEKKVEANNDVEEKQPEYYWILNTNTKKVHKPTCNSVKQMKEKNKKESDLSPEELKEKGYEPCKNCNPF